MTVGPRVVVVLTGSELARGDKTDANGAFLAHELTSLGLEPARILIVGDDPAELEDAVREGLAAEVCVLSGGLGPTHDDRTVETLARVSGRELRVDDDLAREIQSFVRERLSAYAYPRAIEFIDDLPKTLTGKIRSGGGVMRARPSPK